ncbi:MAG: UDP-N-acetyl-D-glucosamine dehydrogenase, partial [Solirubrobacteraceae bacterium]|nr:UDP-N-acetyl-D-glucosamine dehydrogenase [Solirubrobacteraceae bacterium]
VALDNDPTKIAALRRGESYVEDVPASALEPLRERIRPTTRYAALAEVDAILLCVPTPLTRNREPDLGALVAAASGVAGVLQAGQLVVLESTTYPGTTRERLVPILEESGLKAGRDFDVAYSPERVDPGRTDHTMRTTPKVVGGLTDAGGTRAQELYGRICDEIVCVGSPEVAEMTKLLENIFRSVNIALVNELSILCDRMGIDVWEVVDAAASKPFGFMRFEPGPGMGGHCLPVDPFYLSWKAREYDLATEFIELAGKVNAQMPMHCIARIERALNDVRKPVNGTRILLIGMSYKAGVGDVRESPAVTIAAHLQSLRADLAYHDPYVPEVPELGLRSVELGPAVEQAELVVVLTAHPEIDYAAVADTAPVVVDFRGVLRAAPSRPAVRRR